MLSVTGHLDWFSHAVALLVGKTHISKQAPKWRRSEADPHGVCVRMGGSPPSSDEANHSPIVMVVVVDVGTTKRIIRQRLRPGINTQPSDRGTIDPNGCLLKDCKFQCSDVGMKRSNSRQDWKVKFSEIDTADSSLVVPNMLAGNSKAMPLMLELSDGDDPSSYAYRRLNFSHAQH